MSTLVPFTVVIHTPPVCLNFGIEVWERYLVVFGERSWSIREMDNIIKHFSFLSLVCSTAVRIYTQVFCQINFVAWVGRCPNRQLVPSEGPLGGSARKRTARIQKWSGASPSPCPFGAGRDRGSEGSPSPCLRAGRDRVPDFFLVLGSRIPQTKRQVLSRKRRKELSPGQYAPGKQSPVRRHRQRQNAAI